MHLLLAEDEEGILEALAAFLRMRGHVVRTAPSCRAALDGLAAETFDAVITDWRLGDGSGADVLAAAPGVPAVVMSGWPEEVAGADCDVLTKPVRPGQLVEAVERLGRSSAEAEVGNALDSEPERSDRLNTLPIDCRARLQLVLDALREQGIPITEVALEDDGEIVTMGVCTGESEAVRVERALVVIESTFADFRVRRVDGTAVVDARLWRDGRPDHVEKVVRLQPPSSDSSADWPQIERLESADGADLEPVAVDCEAGQLTPQRFLDLLDRVGELRRVGREVYLLNLSESLRLLAETQGRGADLPTRRRSGPRLPPVLQALWR